MRTEKQIEKQVEGLLKERRTLPEYNAFGDNNWARVDAQIQVLQGKKNPEDFYEESDEDEINDVALSAEEAKDWLEERINKDLYEI